jgi:hypothetical protein
VTRFVTPGAIGTIYQSCRGGGGDPEFSQTRREAAWNAFELVVLNGWPFGRGLAFWKKRFWARPRLPEKCHLR